MIFYFFLFLCKSIHIIDPYLILSVFSDANTMMHDMKRNRTMHKPLVIFHNLK